MHVEGGGNVDATAYLISVDLPMLRVSCCGKSSFARRKYTGHVIFYSNSQREILTEDKGESGGRTDGVSW